MKYLVVVPAKAYPIEPGRFAMESSFCDHLTELRSLVSPPFDEIVVATAAMSAREYLANEKHLGVLDAAHHRIRLHVLHEAEESRLAFARRLPRVVADLHRLVRDHDLVHSGPSHDLTRPTGTIALALGAWLHKPTIAVTDIDNRKDAAMNLRVGRWSRKSYLLCRYLYDPIRHLQQELAVRHCSLVLYKGDSLVRDYGRGQPHVRGMWDPGFSAEHVIRNHDVEAKIEALRDPRLPLEILYFGRLTSYKGVDRCIEAVARARQLGRTDVRLTIMGSGEDEASLRELSRRRLGDAVRFLEPVRYGERFFAMIRPHHLMLAAPLSNDTPRSTWDAIASAIPVLAFGTEFYRSLEQETGVVETVPWPSVDAMAERIAYFAEHREALVGRMRRAIPIAYENTSERWLRRRAAWTLDLIGHRRPASVPDARALTSVGTAGAPCTDAERV